ncbi:MAG TPA: C25 family cysteine peptidase, partial [Myxococcota bacterium]|nr:C25 family cysteine peptidase [Myxococcota bacterium]
LLSFTCFDGAFVGPWAESLAWGFVRNPAGGALAATAAATLSDPSALRRLSLALACGLARERAGSLGQVFQAALASLAAGSPAERDMARAYHLLGDPATPVPGR